MEEPKRGVTVGVSMLTQKDTSARAPTPRHPGPGTLAQAPSPRSPRPGALAQASSPRRPCPGALTQVPSGHPCATHSVVVGEKCDKNGDQGGKEVERRRRLRMTSKA